MRRVSQQQPPEPPTGRSTAPTGRPDDASPWAFAGMIALASAFFLFAATPTVVDAPWWAVALLMLVWVAALVQACRWFIRRPVAVLVLAVLLVIGWFAVVMAGARWLDWA